MAESHVTYFNTSDISSGLRWNATPTLDVKCAIVEDVSDDYEREAGDQPSIGVNGINSPDHGRLDDDTETALGVDNVAGSSRLTNCVNIASAVYSHNQERGQHDVQATPAHTSASDSVVADGKRTIRSERIHLEAPVIGDKRNNGTTYHRTSYQDLFISGNARLHAGNVYNSFYNSFHGSASAASGLQSRPPRSNVQAATVCQASCALLVALLGAFEQLCLLVQVTVQRELANRSLQVQIKHEVAVFEDALGSTFHIDTQLIGDWDSFNFLLTRAFRNKQGSQRIANSKYRLFQRSKSELLLHPLDLPPFLDVFRLGEHVQMSIHFDADEISNGQCGRCGLVHDQDISSLAIERTCSRCNFVYRSNVISHREGSSPWSRRRGSFGSDVERSKRNGPMQRSTSSQDNPGCFNRISIEQPRPLPPRLTLQDIIKRYNFAGVPTTLWQDPWASNLPHRGAGKYTVPLQAMSKAYTPVYRDPTNSSKSPKTVEQARPPRPVENLQDIIKRYNFAGVASTPWQDPRSSNLPHQYTVSPQGMPKAYTPVYRYPISPPKAPELTEDEASDGDMEGDDRAKLSRT
jgi:hypothetical protein